VFPALEHFIDQQKWLDTVGDPLQRFVTSLFTNGGDSGKQAKNFLNGTWLGHPLHPVLTDVPVGAWVSTLVLDTAASLTDDASLEKAADITLAVGLAGATGSALTGWTDWSDTYGQERKLGLLHGLTMVATVLAYTGSLIARLSGARAAGVSLANTGLGLLTVGAYLGGDQVYDIGYGVNHTAFLHGPGKFVSVMAEAELAPERPTKADAQGVAVVLVKQGDQIYALDDTCVHAGCSLSGGKVEGASIICPCHGSQYDLRDGSVINGPATMPEPHYEVRVQNGTIEVKQA
jgi:nitrite reductase/ring-hydroxylating ferredoxin subunit/uncharacterized membrane protein